MASGFNIRNYAELWRIFLIGHWKPCPERREGPMHLQPAMLQRNAEVLRSLKAAQHDKRFGLFSSRLRKLLHTFAHAEHVFRQLQMAALFKDRDQFVELRAGVGAGNCNADGMK